MTTPTFGELKGFQHLLATDNSMAPFIQRGDCLVVEPVDRYVDPGVYVLADGDVPIVRVVKWVDWRNRMEVRALNRLEAPGSVLLDAEELDERVLARVRWVGVSAAELVAARHRLAA